MAASFNFKILPGQALAYPAGTKTPPSGKYLQVTGTEMPLSGTSISVDAQAIMRDWFLQSITPLVGPDAKGILAEKMNANPTDFETFLGYALAFRNSLE